MGKGVYGLNRLSQSLEARSVTEQAGIILIMAGCVLRLVIICLPMEKLLARWGSDDLFYYTQVAGHIANGSGSTFDGIHFTNGFQPLFMGLLIPFGKIFLNDADTALRGVLIIISLLTLGAVFQIKSFFTTCENRDLGLIFGALLFTHPKILSVTFHGTEAALTLLMVVLALKACVEIENNKNLLWSSLAFSGLVLTRFDLIILLFFIFLYLMWRRVPIKRLFWVSILPFFVLVCWLGINWSVFGNFLPDSGVAKSLTGSFIAAAEGGNSVLQIGKGILGAIHTLLMAESNLSMVTLILAAIGWFWSIALFKENQSKDLPYLLVLILGGAVILGASLIKLHSFRDWYLMPLYLVVIWLMSVGVHFILTKTSAGGWIIVILPLMIWAEAEWKPRQHMAPHYLEAAVFIEQNLPPGTRIGSFNSGLYGARLGDQFTVINLDGVVNHEALLSLKQFRLTEFIKETNIAYLIDHSGSVRFFSSFSSPPISDQLDLIHKLTFEGLTSDISIFEIKR